MQTFDFKTNSQPSAAAVVDEINDTLPKKELTEKELQAAQEDFMAQCRNGKIKPFVDMANQLDDLSQRARLLDLLKNSGMSYASFFGDVLKFFDFDVNQVFKTWLAQKNVNVLVDVPDFTLIEQLQYAFADRAILYIYRDFLQLNNEAALKMLGIEIDDTLLVESGSSYEEWCKNPLLKQRSTAQAKALYEWFKANRFMIESHYKTSFGNYDERWNDVFSTEIKNRCLLLIEKCGVSISGRTQVCEIFNNTIELHDVLMPYAFFELMNSFEIRLAEAVLIDGRNTPQQKQNALLRTINGINQAFVDIFLEKGFRSGMAEKLLEVIRGYCSEHCKGYYSLLKDLLRSNGTEISSLQLLENTFLRNAIFANMFNYLLVYSMDSLNSYCGYCSLHGMFRVNNNEPITWGITMDIDELLLKAPDKTLPEILRTYHVELPVDDFYTKFQDLSKSQGLMNDNEDLIDEMIPLSVKTEGNTTVPPKKGYWFSVFSSGGNNANPAVTSTILQGGK